MHRLVVLRNNFIGGCSVVVVVADLVQFLMRSLFRPFVTCEFHVKSCYVINHWLIKLFISVLLLSIDLEMSCCLYPTWIRYRLCDLLNRPLVRLAHDMSTASWVVIFGVVSTFSIWCPVDMSWPVHVSPLQSLNNSYHYDGLAQDLRIV
jgi:hypothetical protein